MKETNKQIVANILLLAKDKSSRVMLDDCVEWLEEKMKLIAKYARKLPRASKPTIKIR